MSDLLSKLLGRRVLYETRSPFNGELLLVKDLFGKRLLADNLSQSGSAVGKLWEVAASKIDIEPKTVLILGLGAGSCLAPIRKRWPSAKIVGIEIDPKMIEVGRKFFDLDEKNLRIHIQDAFEYVKKTKDRFDLIVVDLFSGELFPKEAESENFIRNLKSKGSLIIINRLYFGKNKATAQKFSLKLGKYFKISSYFYPNFFPSNMLIFAFS